MSVDETLSERGAVYGDYYIGVKARADIMDILNAVHVSEHNCDMPHSYRGMLLDVVNKLCRLAATPTHIDSWHDVQGYAKLSEDYFKLKEQQNEK